MSDGSLPRDQIKEVIEANACVPCSISENKLTMVNDHNPEVIVLPEAVPRKLIHRIARKTGIEIAVFYNPELKSSATKH